MPREWPQISSDDLMGMADLSYSEVVAQILLPFINGIELDELEAMAKEAYDVFVNDSVVPLRQLSESQWLMELFHGPTLAFKDICLLYTSPSPRDRTRSRMPSSA